MQGNETETRRDIEPTGVDPRRAQQQEVVRQMEAEGFMAAAETPERSPPIAAGPRP